MISPASHGPWDGRSPPGTTSAKSLCHVRQHVHGELDVGVSGGVVMASHRVPMHTGGSSTSLHTARGRRTSSRGEAHPWTGEPGDE